MKQPFNKDEFYENAIKELQEDSLYRDFDDVVLKSKDIEVLETGKRIYDYILNGDMRKLPYDYYNRAKYEIKLKDLDAAGKDFKMAVLERTKENSYYDTELLEECIKFLSKQDGKDTAAKFLEEAEIELDKKIKIDPSNMGCKLIVADLYKSLGKKEKLLDIYLELCEALPFNNYESYVTDIYKSAKKYGEALNFLSGLIEKYPEHKEFYYSRAAIYLSNLRDYENAIKDFQKYAELSDNKPDPSMNTFGFIADCYTSLGNSEKATEYANKQNTN